MRDVAGCASFRLHHRMFMNKGSSLLRMALETNRVIGGGCAQLPYLESAVLVVAIRALHQAFVHPMMEGPAELLFDFQVAAVAELGLLVLQQAVTFLGVMGIMAIRATHIVLQVRRPPEIRMLRAKLVASQATRADIRRRSVLECKNL